ncbi:MAG: hypothetical protein AB7E52_06585 [Bdellovibrionales bacterium]
MSLRLSSFTRQACKSGLLAALLVGLGGAAPCAAANESCQAYPTINVKITPVIDEAQINKNLDLAGIQALSASPQTHQIPHYDSVTLGLAVYDPFLKFNIPLRQQHMPDGAYCSQVQKVDAEIGYHTITIYIANEFPEGSCAYQTILTHERKHVAVNNAILKEYIPKIQQRLQSYLKINGRFVVPNKAYAEKTLRERLTAIIQEVSKEMLEENKRRQRLIDSPQEYAKNNTACGGVIARTALHFKRSHRR